MRRIWLGFIAVAACKGAPAAPPDAALPAWDPTLPDASVMGVRRGLTPARGIIHLHSPYSWDACDQNPQPMGVVNEPCLQDLRAALCTDKIDFAALTDHNDSMSQQDLPTLFNMRDGDVALYDAEQEQNGSRITCDDGHQVLLTVGTENTLMPIMLDRHVPGTVADRQAIYTADTADAVAAFHAAGGLAWIAHTEQHDISELRAVVPDGIEVYNLHANIDPKIRGPYLGLDPDGAIDAAVNFVDSSSGHPEPDLALLSFLTVAQPDIDRWNLLLGDGRHVPVTVGSDAHENAIPIIFPDGERGDSYRRVLRWFANDVLVADPHDPAQIKAALRAGQMYAAFEIMGTPAGFDVYATTAAGATVELGGQLAVADAGTLTVDVPTVFDLDPSLPAPEIHASIIHVDASGATVIATGDGPTLTAPMSAAGAYRVEISIVPNHLGPYLHDLGPMYAQQELPWIYASPIYVQ